MKQFLKSIFCITLLLSVSVTSVHARRSCDDRCSRDYSCDKDCNFSCDKDCRSRDCGSCSDSCDNSCSSDDKCDSCCTATVPTHVNFRSQGADTALWLMGSEESWYRPNMCENYGSIDLAYKYQRSRRFKNSYNKLKFQGSLVPNRDEDALVADNFGLSRTCNTSVSFCPTITNHIVYFGYYQGLDCWCPGMFFRLHTPVVVSKFDLRPSVKCDDNDNNGYYDTCYQQAFDRCYVSSSNLSNSSTDPDEALSAPDLKTALSGTYKFGDKQTSLSAGRFRFCSDREVKLADIDLILGYNFLLDECSHFGLYGLAVIPTGTKYCDRYVFPAQVGNGRHFQLGIGLTGHSTLWSGCDSNLSLWVEGYVSHGFKDKQCRSFDLCNGPFSRYMLLKEFESTGTGYAYTGKLVNAANYTQQKVDVKIDVMGEATIKLAYNWCGFTFDLGYNIYGQDRETIRQRCDENNNLCSDTRKRYGIKGTESVCCRNYPVMQADILDSDNSIRFIVPNGTDLADVDSVSGLEIEDAEFAPGCPIGDDADVTTSFTRSNTTQPNATAFSVDTNRQNPAISDSACGVCLSTESAEVTEATALTNLTSDNGFIIANTSNPELLSQGNINIRSGEAPSILTHKVFAFFNYTWLDTCGFDPRLGVGFDYETSGKNSSRSNCDNRLKVRFASFIIKGGISF